MCDGTDPVLRSECRAVREAADFPVTGPAFLLLESAAMSFSQLVFRGIVRTMKRNSGVDRLAFHR